MKLKQLSVFLENRPGQLEVPISALAGAGLNIITVTLADTAEFGILRLLLPDWQRAREVLEAAGCVVNVAEVVGVDLEHRPGALERLLVLLDAAGINIEYMYALAGTRGDCACMVMRFDDPDCAVLLLQQAGFHVVGEDELT
ncbi:MAG: amino acid-binding protein [Armatimonadetes bacterium]|nr:amino acid-binding protein [Armatimonadota bacterium]